MIAICIGHSRGDGGALSAGGVNEWNFNRNLGALILQDLRDRGFDAMLIDRYAQASYSRAMDYLAASLKSRDVEVAVELHFNSADSPEASGHEWLYWHSSVPGRALAMDLDRRMTENFQQAKRRGIKPITGTERGGLFLSKTHCPAVICEPFFGSNPQEWALMNDRRDLLCNAITNGIDDWKGGRA